MKLQSVDSQSDRLLNIESRLNINSLPNDKFVDMFKLKAHADDKNNVVQMMIPVSDRLENIVGKGENAGYQHFLLFPQCFP